MKTMANITKQKKIRILLKDPVRRVLTDENSLIYSVIENEVNDRAAKEDDPSTGI